MKVGKIQILPIDQLARAPKLPGVYCWLARPNLEYFNDIASAFENEEDSLDALLTDLKNLLEASKAQDLAADIKAPFGTNWKGSLVTSKELKRGRTPSGKTKSVCNSTDKQILLSELLLATFPIFWSPIYIGVSVNLKVRLNTHQMAYEYALQGLLEDSPFEGAEASDLDASKDLARRLVSAEYLPEHLWIALLPIEDAGTSNLQKEARSIAEAAESWLNHYNTPRLGRL